MRLSNIAIYDKSTIDFYNQGLGILSDAISSESTEAVQDNGNITYEMTLKYPINGVLADKLKLPNLIRAQESEDPNDFMIFEIYDYDEDDDGEMTVYAQALPYRVLRLPFNDEAKFATKYNDVQELFDDAIKRVTGFPTWFKINSDVKLASNLNFKDSQFENLGKLLEATMSLIDATVEYQWNQINILQSRGRDLSNIVLRDDKNTNGVKITGSYEKIINKVVPIIRNRNNKTGEFEDGTHMGSVVTSKDPFKWIPYYAGVTAAFDSQEEANNYISSNKLDNPAITVDVTPLMVDEDLTQVHTFDRITAYSTKLKYQDTLQVTTRVFDQLNAEVVSFKMGSIKKDINSTTSYTLSSLASEIARAQNIARVAARSADGKNTNYYAEATPADPIEGDLWFHKIDGKDIMQQYINGEWTTIVKDGMGEEIQAYVDQKMLENDEALAGLNTKLQDNDKALAGLNTKLQDNDEVMDKLHTDLESNTQTIKDNKQAIDDAMGKVNENLTQAQSDVKKAVSNADQAVANAKSSADASGLATQTANAAKQLATEVSNNFPTVKKQADKAATQANQAVIDANAAKANATQAINDSAAAKGQANTAISNATDALNKFNSMQIGGTNLLTGTSEPFVMGYGIPDTTWDTTNQVSGISLPVTAINARKEVLPQGTGFPYTWMPGVTYTQSIYISTDAPLTGTPISFTWLASNYGHDTRGLDNLVKVSTNVYRAISTYTWPSSKAPGNGGRNADLMNLMQVFDFTKGTFLQFYKPKLEIGNKATDWSPAPEDVQQQFTDVNGELSQKVSQTTYNVLAGTVDTVSTLAKQNQSTIRKLATSSSVDAVSGRVTKAQSLAEQTAGGLTFKADKSVVDTIDDTVKQQGIDLKAAQGELKLKMTQSDLTKGLNGYATQTWAQNKITATATGLETQLSSVTQRLNTDDRPNLITGSLQNLNNWVKNSIAQDAIKNNVFVNGTNTMTYQGVSATEIISATLPTVAGNSYVVSIDFTGPNFTVLKGFGWGPAIDFGTDKDHFATLEPGADNKRYIFRFTASGNDTIYLRFGNVDDGHLHTFIFANLSVQLDAVSQVTVTALSKLSQTVDGLTGTFATKNDLAATASNLKLTADGLTFKADKSVVDTIDDTVKQQGIDLKAAQGELKLKMTQSDLTKGLNGYATQTWAQNKITATATGLETQLSSVTQRLNTDDRPNLITGSLQNLNNWVKNSIAQDAIKNNVFVNGTNTMTYQGVSATEIISATLPTVAGNSYVVSIDFTGPNFTVLKGFGWGPAIDFGTDKDHFATLEPGADNKRYIFRFTASGNDTIYLRFGNVHDGHLHTFIFANLSVQLDAVSQVTVTALSKLSQTVDGLSATFAKKTDLNTTASNLKLTADGLNLLTTATGKKGEKVAQVISDVNNIKTTMTGPNGYTTRLQTLEGFQQTATSQLNDKASKSQTTQLQGLIDARVMVDGKIAAALSLSADGGGTVTIRGASLYVTAASHFDNASIKSAAIANLDAAKITSGSISSDRLVTTKLNADNITSGSIAAARIATTALSATNITSGTLDVGKLTVKNLSANLIASGTIDASKITVKNLSASNIIGGKLDASIVNVKNLNASNITSGTIDAGKINVVNLNASNITSGKLNANLISLRATESGKSIGMDGNGISGWDANGKLRMKWGIQDLAGDGQSDPSNLLFYTGNGNKSFSIGTNTNDTLVIGSEAGGMSTLIRSNKNITLDTTDLYLAPHNLQTRSWHIRSTQNGTNQPMMYADIPNTGILGHSNYYLKDVFTYNGYIRKLNVGFGSGAPQEGDLSVGSSGGKGYVQSMAVYNRTGSVASNVGINPYGTLYRATSASKYKLDISNISNIADQSHSFLSVEPKQWFDKSETEGVANELTTGIKQSYDNQGINPYYGFIAEDLHSAGLDRVISYGNNGDIEGIQYDRLTIYHHELIRELYQRVNDLEAKIYSMEANK